MTKTPSCMRVSIVPAKDASEEFGEQMLRAHGCHIEKGDDRWDVHFPEGTTREALDIPAIIRARFTLPDGLMVQETYLHQRERSLLDYHEPTNITQTGQSARQIQTSILLQQRRITALLAELVGKAEQQELSETAFLALASAIEDLLAWNKHLTVGLILNEAHVAQRDQFIEKVQRCLDNDEKR